MVNKHLSDILTAFCAGFIRDGAVTVNFTTAEVEQMLEQVGWLGDNDPVNHTFTLLGDKSGRCVMIYENEEESNKTDINFHTP